MSREASKPTYRPHFLRRWWGQTFWGWHTRRWPWNVPWQVCLVSRKVPQHVIDYFNELERREVESGF